MRVRVLHRAVTAKGHVRERIRRSPRRKDFVRRGGDACRRRKGAPLAARAALKGCATSPVEGGSDRAALRRTTGRRPACAARPSTQPLAACRSRCRRAAMASSVDTGTTCLPSANARPWIEAIPDALAGEGPGSGCDREQLDIGRVRHQRMSQTLSTSSGRRCACEVDGSPSHLATGRSPSRAIARLPAARGGIEGEDQHGKLNPLNVILALS